MIITIFSDASYCPDTGVGAWAAWAKYDGNRMREAGKFRTLAINSTHAEMMAIVNALHTAMQHFQPHGATVLIQTDSIDAISRLSGYTSKKGKKETSFAVQPAVDQFREIVAKYKISICMKHVRAHVRDMTPREAVNDWCDRTAKALMREARKEYLQPVANMPGYQDSECLTLAAEDAR